MLEEIWNITIIIDNENTRTVRPRAMLGSPARCFNDYKQLWFIPERVMLHAWTLLLGYTWWNKTRWFIHERGNKQSYFITVGLKLSELNNETAKVIGPEIRLVDF